jgi:hypothetical protein
MWEEKWWYVHPVGDIHRKCSHLVRETSDELSITAQKIIGHGMQSATVWSCLNRSLFKTQTRADKFWWIQNSVTLCSRNKMSVCLSVSICEHVSGIHDVTHLRHTNIDDIGDKLDTSGTWKNKVSEWRVHNRHSVGRDWRWCISNILCEEVGLTADTVGEHQVTWNTGLDTFRRYETACRLVDNYRQCEETYCRYSHVSCGPTIETE